MVTLAELRRTPASATFRNNVASDLVALQPAVHCPGPPLWLMKRDYIELIVTAEGAGMEFRLLGSLEVCADGRPIALGGPRERATLLALLLRANEVVTVPYLVDAVWERLPASPETNLRTYVSSLRSAC